MWKAVILSSAIILGFIVLQVYTCNEAVCGSIVSKCLLTQQCKCDLKNCTCCKDCYNCLSYLYAECCSCVDMCPKPNETDNVLGKKSHVQDFAEPVPELFNVLMGYSDPNKKWNSTTFPIDLDISQLESKKQYKTHMQSAEQEVAPIKPNLITINCTVAFLSKCMSWLKCKSNCQSVGASSYRWFHDGCCECIGQGCINYGINESRCRECPMKDELDDVELDLEHEEDDDYGQYDSQEVDD